MIFRASDNAIAALERAVDLILAGDQQPIYRILTLKRQEGDDRPLWHWTKSNQIMAYSQTGSLDCRGFQQWKAVNRSVVKGARASYILIPLMRKGTNDDGEEEMQLYGFGTTAVFAIEQTEGDPLPVFDYSPQQPPPLSEIAERLGSAIKYTPMSHAYGTYGLKDHAIHLATHDPYTFFHELAHAIHHKLQPLKPSQDPLQETVAELAAAALMYKHGKNYTGNAWHYIRDHYKTKEQTIAGIQKAISTVSKILEYIYPEESTTPQLVTATA